MAFSTATGYGSLPNGNFSPVIYSKQVQLAFRKTSVVEEISNSDYFGEIANMGDSVKIIKEPEITVKGYSRGTVITPQDLDDEDFTLKIDKANYFAFKVDDIEEAHSHVNFQHLALGYFAGFKQSALHSAADAANTTVSGTVAVSTAGTDELLSSMKLDASDFTDGSGTAGSANNTIVLNSRAGGATDTTPAAATTHPLTLIARMGRKLDQQSVDSQGRWLVVDPVFMELLKNGDFGGNQSGLANGLAVASLHGFKVYMSNNLPSVGTGPGTSATSNTSNYGAIIAGHSSSVATAEQINKTETYRDPDSFADIVRGMHMYGRKILRPEAIVRAIYNIG